MPEEPTRRGRVRTPPPNVATAELSAAAGAWAALARTHTLATCFHQPEWLRLVADCYGYRPLLLVQRNDQGELIAGVPVAEVSGALGRRRWVALPFTDECPPLLRDEASLPKFTAGLQALRQRVDISGLAVHADLATATVAVVGVTHDLSLSHDPGTAWNGFRSSIRQGVRKAERCRVKVRCAVQAGDMDIFYDLHLDTRRRQGVPVQPRRYFRLLWQSLLRPGKGNLLIAELQGRPIAAAIFLTGGRTVTYKYGASDRQYWSSRPNHALFWHAIERACDAGYSRFDLGRSDMEDSGLRAFKSNWGATERLLRYTTLSESARPSGLKTGARLIRPIVRKSPPIVVRALGELLYKYAA